MTRQHFQAMADAIKSIENHTSRRDAAMAMASVCRQFNSAFKMERFLDACGIDSQEKSTRRKVG